MCQKWFVPAPILLSISFEIGVTTVATFNLANWYSIEMFDGIGFHWGQLVKTFQKVKVNWNWKFGARPLFRSFESPFWMSTSFIWQSSEQKIDLQSIQQFNSWQLLQSSSAAKLYIWVSFKVNFNFFGRLSAFATEWWMQGCTLKPSAPKVFTNFNSNFPFPSRKLWNYFQFSQKLQGCIRDAFCSQSFDKFQEKPRGGGKWPLSRQQQPSSAI